MKHATKRSANY